MSGRARESGSIGDKIWVENEMTHKLLKTKVIDHGKVILITAEGTI
jgi:flagella basal body P-ring formation protein FlgA